ncbi:MAG TPA: diguanylate cyclase [Phycisphaerales bacterium]|nr:diguanylate cyclase [Phycisphaerales bacterium]
MPSSSTTQGHPGFGQDAYDARVVLVGQTGLDTKLRLDPDIELIRVRSAFDAIGELANPVGGPARRTVVIVGQGSDVGGRAGSADDFTKAIRKIIPEAVMVVCAQANHPPSGAYDIAVSPTVPSEELHEMIHGHGPTPEVAPRPEAPSSPKAPEPSIPAPTMGYSDMLADGPSVGESGNAAHPEHTPAETDPAFPEASVCEGLPRTISAQGDAALVAVMLGGRRIIEPAMNILRARTGRAELAFAPKDLDHPVAPDDAVEVVFGVQHFGWLHAELNPESMIPPGQTRATDPELTEHARWLAGWLSLEEQHRRLRAEALTDAVSGAWNRRYFDRFLAAAIAQAKARRHMLTVLVFDLDNFKSFNDEFGHDAGDMILRETVRLMRTLTRQTDRICRIGGDEFAVIFYEPEGPRDEHSAHPSDFAHIAERFQREITAQRFPKLGIEAPGRLTISGGLATFPWDGMTAEELLHKADQLALESKRAGKNAITLGTGRPRADS